MSLRGTPRQWSPYDGPGENSQSGSLASRLGPVDAALLLIVAACCTLFAWKAGEDAGYVWNWSVMRDFLVRHTPTGWEPGLLLRGLWVTIRLGLWSMLLALCVGGMLGVASARKRGPGVLPARLYVQLIRNTPPLVLLFLIYFFAGNVLPLDALETLIGLAPGWLREIVDAGFAPAGQRDRMIAAVLTLGLYEGAYVTEIVRGGIESVHRSQWEASAALGFSKAQQLRLIIFPQALRAMLPPLAGQVISTFKDSALASLISLPELTFQSLEVMAVSRMTFEIWITSGTLYLLLGLVCAWYGRRLEKRTAWRA